MKRPKQEFQPETEKTPRSPEGRDFYQFHPSWRIKDLRVVDPFGWHACKAEELNYIRERLSSFETMTWKELLLTRTSGHHQVELTRLDKRAQELVREIFKKVDFDELLSLRLSGKQRVWGKLDDAVLSLLFWDPEHLICPSLKKHT